jgi:hypothetical protein
MISNPFDASPHAKTPSPQPSSQGRGGTNGWGIVPSPQPNPLADSVTLEGERAKACLPEKDRMRGDFGKPINRIWYETHPAKAWI